MARFWSRWWWKFPSRSRAMQGTQGPGEGDQRPRPSQKTAEVSRTGRGDVEREVDSTETRNATGATPSNDPQNHQQPKTSDADATSFPNISVDTNIHKELNALAEQLLRHHDRILAAEADAQRLRLEQQFQLQACQYTLRFLNESRLAIEAEISAVKTEAVPATRYSLLQLDEKHDQYDQDYEYLSQRLHEALAIEQTLAKTENYLVQKRDSFGHSAQSFLDKVSQHGTLSLKPRVLDDFQRRGSTSSLSLHASEPVLHPLLQAYYESVGSVNILHERLEQVEADYNDASELRGLRLDRDETLTISEEAFEASHIDALEDAQTTLEAAKNVENAAKQACIEAGIDLDSATVRGIRPLSHVHEPDMSMTHGDNFSNNDLYHDIDELTSQIVPGGISATPGTSAMDQQYQPDNSIQQWLGRSDPDWEYGVDTHAPESAFDHDQLQWTVIDSQPPLDDCEHVPGSGFQVQHEMNDRNAQGISRETERETPFGHVLGDPHNSASMKDFRPARLARSRTYPSSLFQRRDSQQTQLSATSAIKAGRRPP